MKRILGAVFVTVFGLSLVGSVQADDNDAKAIIDKAIKALGGEEKLGKADAITWKAKGKITFGENDSEFTGQVTVLGLDHFRSSFEGEFGGSQFKAVTVLSGDIGWRKFIDDVIRMDATAIASETQNVYLLVTPLSLIALKGKGFRIEVAGEEKVGDKGAVVLKGTGPDRKDFKLSFDKVTGLPVKQVAKVTGFMGDEFTQERTYSDYKEFGGIKRPTKIVTKRDGEKFVEEEITEYKILDKVDPNTFTEPK